MPTLLLADDSVTIQRVIELTFADEDIEVVAVSDGDAAISRLDTAPPDIVLADVGMPGKSGYDVAEYVKASPRLAHIPVMLLTGAFEPVDQERAKRSRCDGVLAKPFEPQFVISRVRELLTKARSNTPASLTPPGPVPPPAAPTPAAAVPAMAPPAPPAPPAQPAPAAPVPAPEPTQNLEEYFDQLDAAFADLSSVPPRVPEPIQEPDPEDDPEVKAAPAPAPTLPPGPAAAPVVVSSLADAFATLLAAEGRQGPAAAAPTWTAQPPVDLEALTEQVTTRVLAQLSDRVVRETVSNIVSTVAERLVREEIDRIKASLK